MGRLAVLDLNRTVQLVRGALLDAEATWRAYLPEAGDWQKTAFLLTGPLIIVAAVVAYVLGFLGSNSMFGAFRPTIVSTVLGIVMMAISAGVVAFIFSAFSGMFGGKNSFARGLAATTLAFVPGYVGQALSGLPWLGGLLALVLFIWALVQLWKIIPLYLEVPDGKRAPHYIVSLLASIVVMFILGAMMSRVMYGSITGPAMSDFSGMGDRSSGDGAADGMFGGVMRQAELMAAAEEDSYTPPADGRVSERQVRDFLRVMERATELRDEKGERLRQIAEKAEKDQEMSLSDFSQMMGGMTEVAGVQTAEMEVVKTGGGNWAEHQWVRESLRTAWIQKDLNETVAHNYALYQQYQEQLGEYIPR
jgi:hypothetical protein